jgi:flagellar basal-body rod protein FlgC
MLNALDIGASGLRAQRVRLDVIANNVANLNSTRDTQGRSIPFQRRVAVFAAGREDGGAGVRVKDVALDRAPFPVRQEPGHPDANSAGYVRYPNVDMGTEFVNALEATRAYEANVTMMETTKSMFNSALRLIA